MKTKVSAVISDVLLVALIIVGAVWLFAVGLPPAAWTSDRPLLPLIVDWSRVLILLTALGIVLGLVVAAVWRRRPDHIVDGDVIRYTGYERLVHWAIAIGFVLDFVTAAWLLRWLGLQHTPELRPALYVIHFVGAGLILLGAAAFATSARVRGQGDLFPRWRDVSPAIARLFSYLGTYGDRGFLGIRLRMDWLAGLLAAIGIRPAAREGKFLAVEKVLSFSPLAILAVIVIGTGLVKAARYFFVVPPDVLQWSTWLHDLSTWLVVIVVGAHIAATFLVPRNWPGIGAMLHGRIPLHVVEEEFPLWAEELKRPEAPAAAPGAVPAPGTPGD